MTPRRECRRWSCRTVRGELGGEDVGPCGSRRARLSPPLSNYLEQQPPPFSPPSSMLARETVSPIRSPRLVLPTVRQGVVPGRSGCGGRGRSRPCLGGGVGSGGVAPAARCAVAGGRGVRTWGTEGVCVGKFCHRPSHRRGTRVPWCATGSGSCCRLRSPCCRPRSDGHWRRPPLGAVAAADVAGTRWWELPSATGCVSSGGPGWGGRQGRASRRTPRGPAAGLLASCLCWRSRKTVREWEARTAVARPNGGREGGGGVRSAPGHSATSVRQGCGCEGGGGAAYSPSGVRRVDEHDAGGHQDERIEIVANGV